MKKILKYPLILLVGIAALAGWLGLSFLGWVMTPEGRLEKDNHPQGPHDADYARQQAKIHRINYNRLREKTNRTAAEHDDMLRELYQVRWWENAAYHNQARAAQ